MDDTKAGQGLTQKELETLFPEERSHDFFDAFYGGSEDSHFDIRLGFDGVRDNRYYFFFELIERPGKCLACNMTYGLPHVFARHPVINIQGLVADIASLFGLQTSGISWSLGNTTTQSSKLHRIPLIISAE